jgi:putative metallopeptidase DUF4344
MLKARRTQIAATGPGAFRQRIIYYSLAAAVAGSPCASTEAQKTPRRVVDTPWLVVAEDPVLRAEADAMNAGRSGPDSALAELRFNAQMTFAGLRSLGLWYQFPVRLSIGAAECKTPNAGYQRQAGHLWICDELLTLLAAKPGETDDPEMFAAAISAAAAHELGHALIDRLALPRLGREEDAADQFAVWLLFDRLYGGEAQIAFVGLRRLIRVFEALSASERRLTWTITGTHGLTAARLGNLICWTEGFILPTRAIAIPFDTGWTKAARRALSPERRAGCAREAADIRRAWSSLLAPWETSWARGESR